MWYDYSSTIGCTEIFFRVLSFVFLVSLFTEVSRTIHCKMKSIGPSLFDRSLKIWYSTNECYLVTTVLRLFIIIITSNEEEN